MCVQTKKKKEEAREEEEEEEEAALLVGGRLKLPGAGQGRLQSSRWVELSHGVRSSVWRRELCFWGQLRFVDNTWMDEGVAMETRMLARRKRVEGRM